MNTVQGNSPELCLHESHIFDNWFCSKASTFDKVVIVAFHIFTACIPLIVYRCVQYVVLLMEHDLFVIEDHPEPPPRLPPDSPIKALFQRNVLLASKESTSVSTVECHPRVLRTPSCSGGGTETKEDIVAGPLDSEVVSGVPQLSGRPLLVRSFSEVSDQFVCDEKAFNCLVDVLDKQLTDLEKEEGGVELFWDNLNRVNLKRFACKLFSDKGIQYSEEKLSNFIEINFDRAVLVLRARSEIRNLKRNICAEAVEFTDDRSATLAPFDWVAKGIGPPKGFNQFVPLPPLEVSSDSDSDEKIPDRLLLVRPVPDIISRNYSLYLKGYAQLEAMLTPKINMPNPLDQAHVVNKAFELLQVAYTIGLRSLFDIENYTEDADGNVLDTKDDIAILTSGALYHSRAFLFCGQLYHLIREKSYYSVEQQKIVRFKGLPDSWSLSFYKEVNESTQAKMRFLYNQFCQVIVDFLGEEVWEEYFLNGSDYARWYCFDDPSTPYQNPSCMLDFS